jgi:hypothetical protein
MIALPLYHRKNERKPLESLYRKIFLVKSSSTILQKKIRAVMTAVMNYIKWVKIKARSLNSSLLKSK